MHVCCKNILGNNKVKLKFQVKLHKKENTDYEK